MDFIKGDRVKFIAKHEIFSAFFNELGTVDAFKREPRFTTIVVLLDNGRNLIADGEMFELVERG